ncbi:glycerol-3-phosphate 1-O-acyltransferase PlsY [Poriferisphaera sp. WC338]|uniref:glycerol-3-phosphate 1-O-acyltransferase PlsY n=1 Tax=Poriferisphaera sp. WC338 TaxID=3425129 RepID=UPI003D81B253
MSTYWIIWLALAYLSGSIPFGLLIGKLKGTDIRLHGSKNIGATNCGRVLGKKFGILCFLLDVFKGLTPVLAYGLTRHISLEGESAIDLLFWLTIAVAAVLGHMFPVWLKFKGGKGVATGLGVLLGFWPTLTLAAVIAAILWVLTTKISGYVSLASIVAAASLPISAIILGLLYGLPASHIIIYASVTAALATLVIVRHRTNLQRLLAGTENKAAWASRSSEK